MSLPTAGGQTSRTPLGLITQLSVCTQLWKWKVLSRTLLWCIILISAAAAINHVALPKPLSPPSLIHPPRLSSCPVLSLSLALAIFQSCVIFFLPRSPSPTPPPFYITLEVRPFHKLTGKRRVRLSLMVSDAALEVWIDLMWDNESFFNPENEARGPSSPKKTPKVDFYHLKPWDGLLF